MTNIPRLGCRVVHATTQADRRGLRRLRKLPSWLLSQAALSARREVAEALATAGFRRHHFTVLLALDELGPSSQAALGRRLWIDRSDMVSVINDLERDGLVARARDERDRRRNLVRLTAAGADTLRRLDAGVKTAQDTLLEPLSADERRELERLLTRLVEYHGERHGEPTRQPR
jgi:MarR family transcriptional regulator, lower aerobic nicotinate degradation pathway regulator